MRFSYMRYEYSTMLQSQYFELGSVVMRSYKVKHYKWDSNN